MNDIIIIKILSVYLMIIIFNLTVLYNYNKNKIVNNLEHFARL